MKMIQLNILLAEKNHETLNYHLFILLGIEVFKRRYCLQKLCYILEAHIFA